jgi:hypothetical protein
MGKVYQYQAIVGASELSMQSVEQVMQRRREARDYDYLYQFNYEDGSGIGWQMGMTFPRIAMEEGVAMRVAIAQTDVLDHWMARFMLKNRVRWIQERQNRER